MAVFFRNGNGTGVHIGDAVCFFKFRNVGVPGKDEGSGFYGRERFVTVNGEHFCTVDIEKSLFAEHRKFKNHLVNFGVTVSADTDYIFFDAVEHGDDFLGCVTFGQIVSRAMVKDIAEQEDFIRVLIFKGFEQFFTVKSASVDVGCYHKFHKNAPFLHISFQPRPIILVFAFAEVSSTISCSKTETSSVLRRTTMLTSAPKSFSTT